MCKYDMDCVGEGAYCRDDTCVLPDKLCTLAKTAGIQDILPILAVVLTVFMAAGIAITGGVTVGEFGARGTICVALIIALAVHQLLYC